MTKNHSPPPPHPKRRSSRWKLPFPRFKWLCRCLRPTWIPKTGNWTSVAAAAAAATAVHIAIWSNHGYCADTLAKNGPQNQTVERRWRWRGRLILPFERIMVAVQMSWLGGRLLVGLRAQPSLQATRPASSFSGDTHPMSSSLVRFNLTSSPKQQIVHPLFFQLIWGLILY
jgi:hypothetical protein